MEENKNFISYDKNWQNVSTAEYASPAKIADEAEEEKNPKEPKAPKLNISKQYLLTAQLISCLIIAAAAFVLKSTGGEVYNNIRQWYFEQLNASAVFDSSIGFDINSLLKITTPDEAQN